MAVAYSVDVYRREIRAMYLNYGGEGYRWLDSIKLAMLRHCIRDAPNRTGELARGMRSGIRGTNQYRALATIWNDVDYAGYVHGGTEGPIFTNDTEDGYMYLRPGGPGRNTVSPYAGQTFPKKKLISVNGQNANPWIDRACTRIAIREGAIVYGSD